ncbi:MAG TPA: LLM class flavin-dependent oxidoreductase [Streptosporangiaceae bacterium]|jgi:5,10-methylenetetrahydromethanopterin reductase
MSSDQPAPARWGVWLHAVEPVPQLVRLAVAAEGLGAAALLLADEGVDRDLYVTLTAVGVATHQLALIPAITNPHSRHPVATAAALGSLAEVAPGRVVAGLGAGGTLVFGPMGLSPARPFTALAESVEVIDALLDGKTVDHTGEFTTAQARLAWAPGRLPVAIAGRGPRVERLSAERADWVIVSGKPVTEMPAFARTLRERAAHAGRQVRLAWNPLVGWEDGHVDGIRPHLSYMTVDMPAPWRERLGVGDDLVAELRAALASGGPDAAAQLVPDEVVNAFAVIGDRAEVAHRLADAVAEVRPELLVFSAHEYSTGHIGQIAELAAEVGLAPAAGPLLQ